MSIQSHDDKSASRSLLPVELSQSARQAEHNQSCLSAKHLETRAPFRFPNAVNTELDLTLRTDVAIQGEISEYEALRGASPFSALRKIHRSRPSHIESLHRSYGRTEMMSRRFSWLPFRKSGASRVETGNASVPLPGTSSVSSVAGSAISSPVLTSTTNTRVAKRESIRCNNISLLNLSAKINKDGEHLNHRNVTPNTSQEWSIGRKVVDNKQFHFTSTIQGMRKKIKHVRRASTSFLLENKWSERLRENSRMSVTQSDASSMGLSSPAMNQNQSTDHIFNAHSKVEQLLPSGSPMPSIPNGLSAEQHTSRPGEAPHLPRLQTGSTTNLLGESLSGSFTSTIDRLGLQAVQALQPNSESLAAGKLKSVRSCFSLHSVKSEASKSADVKKNTTKLAQSLTKSHNQNATRSHPQSDVLKAINKTINIQAQKPTISFSKPTQLRFSGRKNRYVHAKPDLQSPHGVNPLRMHPEVNTFARPPSRRASPSTPNHKLRRDSSDDDGSEKIDSAIIYSPSTGNLSEYSRKTSSPTLNDGRRQGPAQQDTPTRKPLHKRSGSVLKRSVSSFIIKSTSIMKLGSLTPSRKSKQDCNPSSLTKCTSYPEPQKIVCDGKPNIRVRGRAMSSPNLYCSEGLRAVWDYQPSTPSPLRKATKMGDTFGTRPRAVTTSTPVNIPVGKAGFLESRSATIGKQLGKRYGRLVLSQTDGVGICESS